MSILDVTNAPTRRPGQGKTGVNYRPQLNRQPGSGGPQGHPGGAGGFAVSVTFTGPWADGRLYGIVGEMVSEIQYAVAAQGLSLVMGNLNASIKHPTPYYETQITLTQQVDDLVVNDRGIVYGPWLEGTSSRNHSSRFKGYASFRRATQMLESKVPALIGAVAARFDGAMQ